MEMIGREEEATFVVDLVRVDGAGVAAGGRGALKGLITPAPRSSSMSGV